MIGRKVGALREAEPAQGIDRICKALIDEGVISRRAYRADTFTLPPRPEPIDPTREGECIGRIAAFVEGKGFGFIRPKGKKKDKELFFHIQSVTQRDQKKIDRGVTVAYRVEQKIKGPQAVKVRALEC